MLRGNKVILREKRLGDAANDYAWRKDPDLARLDATLPLTMPYSEYLLIYSEEMNYPSPRRRRFAIDDLEGKHIGNVMYYDIDEFRGEAELGILIGDRDYWDKGYGSDAVITLVNHIFSDAKVQRLYLHTLEWNLRAQKCFEKCGFMACGRVTRDTKPFIVMELRREWWKKMGPGQG